MADRNLREKSVFEVSRTAAKDSETNDFRRLMGKYGAAMLLLFLNGRVIAVLIMVALGITGLIQQEITDFSYAMLMLSNEIASYAFPLVTFYLIFDKEARAVPVGNNYKRFYGDNFLLFAGSIAAPISTFAKATLPSPSSVNLSFFIPERVSTVQVSPFT